jgi:hypothetical protein
MLLSYRGGSLNLGLLLLLLDMLDHMVTWVLVLGLRPLGGEVLLLDVVLLHHVELVDRCE